METLLALFMLLPVFQPENHAREPEVVAKVHNFSMPEECPDEPKAVLKGHTKRITALSLSPDGKALVSASADYTVKLWWLDSPDKPIDLGDARDHYLAVSSVGFRPDGKEVVTFSGERKGDANLSVLKFWDPGTGRMILSRYFPDDAGWHPTYSPDGRTLAVNGTRVENGVKNYGVLLLDLTTGKEKGSCWGLSCQARAIAFSKDGKMLAASQHDECTHIWNVQTRQLIHTLKTGLRDQQGVLAFSPDSKSLATGGDSFFNAKPGQEPPNLLLWDVQTGVKKASYVTIMPEVRCLSFSPDGKLLAIGGSRGLQIVDLVKEKSLLLTRSKSLLNSVAFSPDGTLMATSGDTLPVDHTVKLWRVPRIP